MNNKRVPQVPVPWANGHAVHDCLQLFTLHVAWACEVTHIAELSTIVTLYGITDIMANGNKVINLYSIH